MTDESEKILRAAKLAWCYQCEAHDISHAPSCSCEAEQEFLKEFNRQMEKP
jgi:hypothetical protein